MLRLARLVKKFDKALQTLNTTQPMFRFITPIPFSLYIHMPWCVRKCPYCDFNSHTAGNTIPEEQYIQALLNDLDQQLPTIWGRRITSVFLGGGTPSLFSPNAINQLLTQIHSRLPFGPETEITLEANPGTVDESRFKGFRDAGINRLSIGIQSLQNDKLTALGRIHNRDYALRAIDAAINAGFDNFNLDLMHGLPNQSIDDALADLSDALSFKPPHLSWYQLTIEPNTLFHHQPPVLPKDDLLWEIQEQGQALLSEYQLHQYEVSAYAIANRQCQHNKNYWEFGDYLGIGAGAHSKITDYEKQIITRHWQVKNPKDYLKAEKPFVADQKILSADDTCFEFMLNALRLTDGIPYSLFTERTGLPIPLIESKLALAVAKGLLSDDKTTLRPTVLGQRFLNELIGLFL